MVRCPTDLELERYLEGSLGEAERGRVAGHAGGCPTCRAWLAEASSDDALLGELRESGLNAPQPDPSDAPPGLARYAIVRKLGEGGMGIVYEAEQRSVGRRVALKVMQPGLLTASSRARFEAEARLLSRLDHPGIARLYEADVDESEDTARPFLAMELVEGEPLGEHERRLGAGRGARLRLFLALCDAVAHAHARGVVHRDLKPANVLVRPDGSPVVLDFGVARALDADGRRETLRTRAGQVIGTVPYMAPEQLAGDSDAVDTRADVYALGVILYRLLSGRLPLEVASLPLPEAARAVAEREPPPLGTLDRALRGDLETIAGKALEKEPGRRYESVAALREDVARHGASEPIRARPPSTLYLLRKFARRHRAPLLGAAAAFLALAAGLGAALDQARRARDAEAARAAEAENARSAAAEAEREAQRAFAATGVLERLLVLGSPVQGPAREPTLREALERARAWVERQQASRDPAVRGTVLLALARAHGGLGDLELAADDLERAEAALAEAYGPGGGARAAEVDEVRGELLLRRHDYAGALESLGRALERREAAGGGELARASLLAGLAMAQSGLSRHERAAEIARAALALHESLHESLAGSLAGAAGDPAVARARADLGKVLSMGGELQEAEALLREALPALREGYGELSVEVALAAEALGRIRMDSGDPAGAIDHLEETLAFQDAHLSDDHPARSMTLWLLGQCRSATGDPEGAAADLQRALAIWAGVEGGNPLGRENCLRALAPALAACGRVEEAIARYRELAEVRAELNGPDHVSVSEPPYRIGQLLAEEGRLEEAGAELERARDLALAARGESSTEVGSARLVLAAVRLRQERPSHAISELEAALDGLAPGHPLAERAKRLLEEARAAGGGAAEVPAVER